MRRDRANSIAATISPPPPYPHGSVFLLLARYDCDERKPHPTGNPVAPVEGHSIGDMVRLEGEAASANSAIEQVDFIGHYEDFDYEGNGIYRQWRYLYSLQVGYQPSADSYYSGRVSLSC